MRTTKIKRIVKKISKRYGVEDYAHIEKGKHDNGIEYVEVRTELTSYNGGFEFMAEVEKATGYNGEYEGACVYRFYKE